MLCQEMTYYSVSASRVPEDDLSSANPFGYKLFQKFGAKVADIMRALGTEFGGCFIGLLMLGWPPLD